ncbi:MAG: protein-glutamate O-methyltransferase CheR [Anaerolineales bacterium]|nr:protein-glutamate O-methyltransferase CheR [Anaerolineales bacterium]
MATGKTPLRRIESIEVGLLLSALNEGYGYDFSGYAPASLKRRLMALQRYFELDHLTDMISSVLYDPAVAQTVINRISVPASDFFRDALVWKAVREMVLPALSSFPRINIWQAGCGHGEETYTLAILMHEAGLQSRMRIFSTDINSSFLEEARQGIWARHRLASWRENYLKSGGQGDFDSHFTFHGDEVRICEEFKQSIEFVKHNLVTDHVFKEVQWVVCRNVLIYFDAELQERVVRLLCNSMERGDYLLLGHCERIMELAECHPELQELDDQVQLYRKTRSVCGREHHV